MKYGRFLNTGNCYSAGSFISGEEIKKAALVRAAFSYINESKIII